MPELYSDTFRAMDTDIDVIVLAAARPEAAFDMLRATFEEEEQRFSRFRPTSRLSRLNAGDQIVDQTFSNVCRLALDACRFTAGLFNPMVLPALRDAGYSTTFSDIRGGSPASQPVPNPADCVSIRGDRVQLLDGQLDLGGIAKGWTVDLVVERLLAHYDTALINAGGDMRVAGDEDSRGGWQAAVASPTGDTPAWEGRLCGALATSTTLRRRWTGPSGIAVHHLIDPRTGLPADSPYAQVSCWAPEAWRAEVWAKAVLIGGEQALPTAEAAGVQALAIPVGEDAR